ncbi:MAG: hypothetical protein J3R72DRAFT_480845 [Linnemannia gamsii]|nr:MAG: hypothetical protein J3R72DRAFT_480845 [Linnemannia gamsii]
MPATSLTRITQARQPSLARRRRSQLPTEVLDIIFAHLTQRDLLAVSYVCKTWRPSACHQLWKNIDTLPLNSDFLQLLPTHGHLIHRLDLILHAQSRLEGEPDDLLAQVLQDTPRLQHLCIYLLGYESDEFLQPSFAAISTYVGGSLTSLGLKGMTYAMENEAAAREFFLSLSRLTRFEIDGQVFEDPHLTHVSLADTNLNDGGLLILAAPARAVKLRTLNIRKCRFVQARGIGQVVMACTNLQELNISLCSGVWLDIFSFAWACLGLLRLNIGGIHGPVPTQDGSDNYVNRIVREEEVDNDDDDDGANIYPSASTPSNSDVYESYDEELDNSDDSTGYYWWGYRDPYSVTTDSDESGPYYDHGSDDDSQDNSEQDSEEDDSEEDGSGSGSEDDGSDGSDDNSQDNSEQDSEEENSEENGSGSGSEDDDSDRQSELSSLAESDSDEDEGQDDNGQIESEVSSEAGSSGDDDDDDHNLNGGEVSDEELSDEDEEEDVDSDAGSVEEDDEIEEEVEEEEEQEEDEEEQVEQYSEEEAEEEAEEHYSDGQDEAEEAEYSEEYDEDQYGDYDDDDSGDSEDQESNGGYSSDDY